MGGEEKMRRKIYVLSIVMLLCISSVVIINDDFNVEATSGDGGEGDIGLNFSYIHDITTSLSEVIYTVYDEESGELAKGRAFGTKGEHYAAKNIIEYEMNKMGLWNVTLENITQFPDDTIDDKLEVLAKGITVNNTAANDTKFIVDCYIDPALNESP